MIGVVCKKCILFLGDFVMGRTLGLYEILASNRVGKEPLENVWQALCCKFNEQYIMDKLFGNIIKIVKSQGVGSLCRS